MDSAKISMHSSDGEYGSLLTDVTLGKMIRVMFHDSTQHRYNNRWDIFGIQTIHTCSPHSKG